MPSPLGVLGAAFALQSGLALAAVIVPTPGIAPGLAARSLALNLLKEFVNTSYCVVLDGLPSIGSVDVGAPARHPSVLLSSISAEACSTVGSEYDYKPKGPRRPAMSTAGSAENTAGLRSGHSRRRSARDTLILASGCWGVGEGLAARREEKGQEAGRLRTYLVHERRLHFSRAGVAVRVDSIMFHSKSSCNTTIWPQPSQPTTRWHDHRQVYSACERKGMGCALVLRYRRVCRWGKGLEIQIAHGAHIGRTLKGHRLRCRVLEERLVVRSEMSRHEVIRTFQPNCARYLHDRVRALFPPPSPYHPPQKRLAANEAVNRIFNGTCDDDGHAGRVIRERSLA